MSNWQERTSQVMDVCLATFGETVVYIPEGLLPFEVEAIFDRSYQQVDPATGAIILSTSPVIGVKDSQMPQKISSGDRVIIRGETFRIIENQPDGEAGSRLVLNKV